MMQGIEQHDQLSSSSTVLQLWVGVGLGGSYLVMTVLLPWHISVVYLCLVSKGEKTHKAVSKHGYTVSS